MYLNCHTYYSLRFGTLSPRELLARAKAAGLRKIALTDINNTSCMLDFYQECLQQEIAPVAGIEFRSSAGKLLYIGLAKNNKGFYQLNQFLSGCSEEGRELPERAPVLADTFFIYPISYDLRQPLEEHEFIGIRPQEVSRLYSSPVRYALNKAVVLQSVSFGDPEAYTLHCLLQAIDQNVVLSRLDKTHLAHPEDRFMPQEKLLACFEAYPKVIENTEKLLAACSIHFDLKSPKNRSSFTGSRKDDRLLLEKLARDGFRQRYPNPGKEVVQRFEREISMIDQLGFSPYFLITHDIIRYAQLRGSRHVGRGSGANSLIAYCLDITEVDPVALNLYFERFINPHRSSPPDFDIDFCWDERDEVVDYIFKRFANGHVALLAAINTFQPRALIRELGKVYGLPGQEIEILLKQAGRYHHRQPQEPQQQQQQQQQADEIGQKILYYAEQLSGFPNYLSIHAGGVLITEEPLHNYSAKMMMPKGFPVVHFDMHTAEEFGFYKYDILSQRGLGHIKDSLRLIKENRGEEVDIRQTEKLKKDEKVRERLLNAQTIGCFYIESPGMRGLLSKLHCNTFETLVAASSIIRPGVAQSGMMQEYIRRHNNPEKIEYLHPVFEELLAETYGIMVYQEDVLKIAHHFAGLELGEADVLRRGMSGKGRSSEQMIRIKEKFFRGCREKGHSEALSREVWRQIESFAGYSFCKAHSASYAVESFQSLYLKAYYPLEFMVGVINNFGGFYALEHYVHEARMCGAKIEPPCVNHSQYLATIKGSTIYLGFVHLKELEAATARQLIGERNSNGLYQGFADFLQRVPLKKEQLNLLIRINAFRFSGKSRQALLWEKNSYSLKTPLEAAGKAASKGRASKRNASGGTVPGAAAASSADQHSAARRGTANRGGVINEADHNGMAPREAAYSLSLFTNVAEKDAKLPPLDIHVLEDAFEQIELLGFPICSPFLLLEHKPDSSLHTKDLLTHIGRSIDIAGYFITRKVVRTKHGKLMSFGTWIDEAGFFFDTTHFPQSLEKHPFRGPGCYRIEGKVVEEFGFPSIEVQKMEHLKMITDARYK